MATETRSEEKNISQSQDKKENEQNDHHLNPENKKEPATSNDKILVEEKESAKNSK